MVPSTGPGIRDSTDPTVSLRMAVKVRTVGNRDQGMIEGNDGDFVFPTGYRKIRRHMFAFSTDRAPTSPYRFPYGNIRAVFNKYPD